MKPLISVIVPVYNVEEYLDACVQSIVDQTYSDLEIVLVDDGSPDACGAMCDEWAKKDERIRVIHKENGGQAEARNVGIQQATGEYIGFVDSDDVIAADMFWHLYELLQQHDAQIVGCRMAMYDDRSQLPKVSDEEEITVFDRIDAVKSQLSETHFANTVPNLLIKSDIAKAVPFDVGKIHEDILWPFRVLCRVERAVYTTKVLYFYYQRPGSTMNTVYTEKRFDGIEALRQRAIETKETIPELFGCAERQYMGACMYQYQLLARLPKNDQYPSFQKRLHKEFRSGDYAAATKGIRFKYRIWYALFRIMPNVTVGVRNLLKIGF
ncbi:MAG: glycosyltransferase [Clostridia bacterium]|nr:glycosyltransferase [Clostridia bacterium]